MTTNMKNSLERVKKAVVEKQPEILKSYDLSKFFVLCFRPTDKRGVPYDFPTTSIQRRTANKAAAILSVLLDEYSRATQDWFSIPKSKWQESGCNDSTVRRYIDKLEQMCILETARGRQYKITPFGILRRLEIIEETEKTRLWREKNLRGKE